MTYDHAEAEARREGRAFTPVFWFANGQPARRLFPRRK